MNAVRLRLPPIPNRKKTDKNSKNLAPIHQVDVSQFVKLEPLSQNPHKHNSLPPLPMNFGLNKFRKRDRENTFAPIAMRGKSVLHEGKGIYDQVTPVGNGKIRHFDNSAKEGRRNNDLAASLRTNNYKKNRSATFGINQESEKQAPISKNETALNEEELKQYAFLNQARSLNIFNLKEDEDPNGGFEPIDLDANLEKDKLTEQALQSVKEHRNTPLPKLIEAMNLLFDMDFKDLKVVFDLGDAAVNICEILMENRFSDWTMQLKMLAFLFHVCEDSIFAMNVDLNFIYETICKYMVHRMLNPKISPSKKIGEKEINKMENCLLFLNTVIAKHYYLLDTDRTEKIVEVYLHFLSTNLESVTVTHLLNFEVKQHHLEYKPFPLITSLKNHGIDVLYFFMKNAETRKFILNTTACRNALINILNALGYILQRASLSEMAMIHKKGKRESIEEVMVLLIKSFDFYLNVFKYYDMIKLFENETPKVQCSLQEMMRAMMKFYYDLFKLKDAVNILFDPVHTSNERISPTQGERPFLNPGFDLLMESNKVFFGNAKLYEEQVLNFGEVADQMMLFVEEIQRQIDAKTLPKDFEMFIEAVIQIPYTKIHKMIKKNIELGRRSR